MYNPLHVQSRGCPLFWLDKSPCVARQLEQRIGEGRNLQSIGDTSLDLLGEAGVVYRALLEVPRARRQHRFMAILRNY
jgi:hypothetical protein